VSEEETIAKEYRVGLSGQIPYLDNLNYAVDVVTADDTATYPCLGLEYLVNPYLSFRGGYTQQSNQTAFSGGLGICVFGSTLDFSYKNTKDFGQTFRVGIGYKF
jgi:hypothetical protein